MRAWLRRARVRWTPGALADLQRVVDATPLHPEDRSAVDLALRRAAHFGDTTSRADLISVVEDLTDRYRYPYDPMHGLVVDQIRAGIPTQRGRSVPGKNGSFRRGDAVCRLEGKKPVDAILIEVEPSTEHAVRFGRMAGVQVLQDGSLSRWFLDDLYHGRVYGRPW